MNTREELYVVIYIYSGHVSLVSAHRGYKDALIEMNELNSKEAGDDGEFMLDIVTHVISGEVK